MCQNNFGKANQPFNRIENQLHDQQARMNLYRNKLKKRMIAKKNKINNSAYIYF